MKSWMVLAVLFIVMSLFSIAGCEWIYPSGARASIAKKQLEQQGRQTEVLERIADALEEISRRAP